MTEIPEIHDFRQEAQQFFQKGTYDVEGKSKATLLYDRMELNQLITRVLFRRNPNEKVLTEKFWFWYQEMVPKELEMNKSTFGKLMGDHFFSEVEGGEEEEGGHQQKKRMKLTRSRLTSRRQGQNHWLGIQGPRLSIGEISGSTIVYTDDEKRLLELLGRTELNLDEKTFDRLFIQSCNQKAISPKETGVDLPCDVGEDEHFYYYYFYLPGVVTCKLTLINNSEGTSVMKMEINRSFENRAIQTNLWMGEIIREIELPSGYDYQRKNEVRKVIQNGIIEITLPKKQGDIFVIE